MLHRRGKRAQGLNRVKTKEDAARAQKFPDGLVFQPVTADEMTGRQSDEPRVFVHLPHHVLQADDAEAARVEQADFDSAPGQSHPRINVRRIIIVINQDVFALAKIQAGGDEAQRQRRRPDERNFVRPAIQQLRREPPSVVQPVGNQEGFLIAGGAVQRAIGNRLCHPVWQRTDAGVREEDFSARHREFAPAVFLVGINIFQRHAAKVIRGAGMRQAESKPF